jgi:hypothetical protein
MIRAARLNCLCNSDRRYLAYLRHSRASCPGDGNGLLCPERSQAEVIMRGRGPRIHALAHDASAYCENVDGRIRSAAVRFCFKSN